MEAKGTTIVLILRYVQQSTIQYNTVTVYWDGVARMGEERNGYRVLIGKPEGKRPLGRPRRKWEYGIRMALRETGWGSVDWI
jgi:hypothetical protein